jgi:hypothetical protein
MPNESSDLRAVLSDAGISQAELGEMIHEADPSLTGNKYQVSRICSGMKPGEQTRAAITRALKEKGINFRWDQ